MKTFNKGEEDDWEVEGEAEMMAVGKPFLRMMRKRMSQENE